MRAGAALAGLFPLLGGCSAVVLNPSGDVASQQADLVIIATVLMLLIIVPVMTLTVLFARKYRASNTEAEYEPDWEHSTQLELVIWSAPLLIIIALGAVTWTGTHKLDPYHPIDRLSAGKPVPAGVTPLEVDVVAMDWKWLFIYPQYGVATVNDLAAPVDRPIRFRLTASTVMTDFYIPALAGQIYAMPSMETQLNAVINKPGVYDGFNANYSGDGFNWMKFKFHGLSDAGFDQWIGQARDSGKTLDRMGYLQLDKPSKAVPIMRFGNVAPNLYQLALNNCMKPGTPCVANQMLKNKATAAGVNPESAANATDSAMSAKMAGHGAGAMADSRSDAHTPGPLRGAGLTPPNARPDRDVMAEAAPEPHAPSSL
ncbi:ubiquinol oxidase subunit II [Novosphingobium sp. ZN18A2]|uniref:ubiquinol oxidase subunit II n=1 Tax=Novosphingobium sp. ZN18A2 TaxID=3079861 RepID=UPI0030D5F884